MRTDMCLTLSRHGVWLVAQVLGSNQMGQVEIIFRLSNRQRAQTPTFMSVAIMGSI
jgi:hypothetical protein